jgi:hypothetical protein
VGGPLAFISHIFGILYCDAVLIYLFLAMLYPFKKRGDLALQRLIFAGVMLTHLTYGIYFIRGLLSKDLKS